MATAIGTGYDYSVSQYSPDGRIFQIDYAKKAVDNSTTAVGICFQNGVVLAVIKEASSPLYEKKAFNRIYNIDTYIGMAVAGLTADARQIVAFARKECKSHRELYGSVITMQNLAQRVALMIHAHTTHSVTRPFGCSVLLACYESSQPLLYSIDASGSCNAYFSCSLGKDKLKADSLLEKVDRENIRMDEGVLIASKILYDILEEPKPKSVEYELSFVGEFTLSKHERVPQVLHDRALREATGHT